MIENKEKKVKNKENPKTSLLIGSIALVVFLFSSYYCISKFIKSREYVECIATVEDDFWTGDRRYDEYGDNSKYYIRLGYEYNNKYYTYCLQQSSIFHKSIGDKVKVLVNPKNPSEILDIKKQIKAIFISVVAFYISIGNLKKYKIRKKKIDEN